MAQTSTHRSNKKSALQRVTRWISKAAVIVSKGLVWVVGLLSALWASMLLWVHLNTYPTLRIIAVGIIILLALLIVLAQINRKISGKMGKLLNRQINRQTAIQTETKPPKTRYQYLPLFTYALIWLSLLGWFLSLTPRQDRDWKAEVSQLVIMERHSDNPNLVTLKNVRNFDWARPVGQLPLKQPKQPYFYKVAPDLPDGVTQENVATERWDTRTIDLSKLEGVDIINSYWMGESIGHTLLSFRFSNARPLSFSVEIRKETDENFSAIGGFFRQYEMALVAAEERDIIYTRSNVRGEQVYIFPVNEIRGQDIKDLFLQYLQLSKQLQAEATWYNTVIRNCTTEIYDMARRVSGGKLPWDYRILASGYVPEYLYDRDLLPYDGDNTQARLLEATTPVWDVDTWYDKAHINQKTAHFTFAENQDSYAYSQLIRQALPEPVAVP